MMQCWDFHVVTMVSVQLTPWAQKLPNLFDKEGAHGQVCLMNPRS